MSNVSDKLPGFKGFAQIVRDNSGANFVPQPTRNNNIPLIVAGATGIVVVVVVFVLARRLRRKHRRIAR